MTTTINSTVTGITEAYKNALTSIVAKANANNNVIKINGSEVNTSAINNVEIDLSQLTHSGRKKIAKRISNYDKKGSLKTINFMFHVMDKMGVTKDKVTIGVSHKEAEIQSLRKAYIKLRAETETARVAYKAAKGDFYK
jgi:ribosome recycling factor